MAVVVTGANGYLGGRLAAALRKSGVHGPVIALGRDEADLTVPGSLDTVPAMSVTHIVHAAAVTTFGIDKATATAVNVRGTDQVIEFARRCPDLERLVLLSTVYAAGTVTGEVFEEPRHPAAHDPFANHYEWSKHAAECRVLDCGLPVVVARVATIAADGDSGHVTQFNAVHNTLKLFYYGLLSLMPGDPATPLALVTADFATAAIVALLTAPPGVYHVCQEPEQTLTLGQLMDTTFAIFERDPAYARRGILRPLLVDETAFADLLAGIRSLRRGPVPEALESVAPFAAQLYLPKAFSNVRLRKAWPGYQAADPRELVSATVRQLVATRWGRPA
jgi:nucleoside-diphosphate-sugar epimerase